MDVLTNSQRLLKSFSSMLREKELEFFNKGFEGMDGKTLKELRAHNDKLMEEWSVEKTRLTTEFTQEMAEFRKMLKS